MQTLFIFDWDNTLLASIYLYDKGCTLINEILLTKDEINLLKDLEKCVHKILSLAIQTGIVYIITNAETGWVELSAQKFLPTVYPLFKKIKIISARSTNEKLFPDDPIKWKLLAFEENIKNVFPIELNSSKKQVVSIGDSQAERTAIIEATKTRNDIISKSFLFAHNPDIPMLNRQIGCMITNFDKLIKHPEPLDTYFYCDTQAQLKVT